MQKLRLYGAVGGVSVGADGPGGFPSAGGLPGSILAVSMDLRKVAAFRRLTKKLSFKALDPFHTSRLKNIITFNLQCNQYKYIIYLFLFIL